MIDLIVQIHPGLMTGGIQELTDTLASDPATAPAASSLIAFTDMLPVHLDPAGFLASILTGSQDGPSFPYPRHIGLPRILSFYGYDSGWSADPDFWDVVDPAFAGVPSVASGPREALRGLLAEEEGKTCLLLFSSLDPAEIVRTVAASGRAERTCMAFIGVPAALLDPSLAEGAHHLALRFPAAIVFQGRLTARRIDIPVGAMDLLPTLLETIGLPPFLRNDAPAIEGSSHYESLLTGAPIQPGIHHVWLPAKPRRVSQRGMHKLVIDGNGLRLHFLDRDPAESENVLAQHREIWTDLADSLLEKEDRLSARR
jgi:hypothetical protein